jgi:hypothetical protein
LFRGRASRSGGGGRVGWGEVWLFLIRLWKVSAWTCPAERERERDDVYTTAE